MPAKDRQLNIRMGEKQRAAVVKAAEDAGLSVGAWVRSLIDAALSGTPHGRVQTDPEYRAALDRLRAHLRQADDSPALRYAVLVAAELLDDPAGGTPVKP